MDTHQPLPLLGGLTAAQFMKRHWQKKPLLVRGAVPGFEPVLDRRQLFALAAAPQVESRLVVQGGAALWRMRRGPLPRRALPPLAQAGWTLLVQGVDLHDDGVHALLQRFRFVPEARLDDLMISYATDGGGVGPHLDSYDVFLLQAQGQRRWRIGPAPDRSLQPGLPLKILANFQPTQEWVLEPGDLLYLPPGYGHDGIAQGECQTYSIGFRSPARGELARELLMRVADDAADALGERSAAALYRDPAQPATESPGAMPVALQAFARTALQAALSDDAALERALGEYLTEPKPQVWFEAGRAPRVLGALVLDRRTKMMHDPRHVFVNGESWRAGGRDAALMRRLADRRRLEADDTAGASAGARELLASWCEAGWIHDAGADRDAS